MSETVRPPQTIREQIEAKLRKQAHWFQVDYTEALQGPYVLIADVLACLSVREEQRDQLKDNPLTKDAVKLLELLLSECSEGTSDHSWRKCRRCQAFNLLQGYDPLPRRLIQHAIERLNFKPLPTACLSVCQEAHEEKKEKDDLSRVDEQPLTETAELPQRQTEDVPPTAPETESRR